MSPTAFELDDEQRAALDGADRYARERLAPLAQRMDDEEWWPDEEFRALGHEGYLGITAPPELGGAADTIFHCRNVVTTGARRIGW